MKLVIIGGLTNGNILLDYFYKKKNISIELLITYPKKFKVPRYKKIKNSYIGKLNVIYDLNANKYYEMISKIQPDIIFVIGWSGMIDQKIIDIPRNGCIGFHPSKLPLNRGRSVLAWQIEEGIEKSAYTAFFMTKKPDAGDIIVQQNFTIKKNDYIVHVLDKVDITLKKILPKLYKMIIADKFTRIKQISKKASYRKLRNSDNSIIDWSVDALSIYNKIRAISKPYPGAFYKRGNQNIKVWRSKIVKLDKLRNNNPGKLLKIYKNGNKVFMTKDKPILIYSSDKKK